MVALGAAATAFATGVNANGFEGPLKKLSSVIEATNQIIMGPNKQTWNSTSEDNNLTSLIGTYFQNLTPDYFQDIRGDNDTGKVTIEFLNTCALPRALRGATFEIHPHRPNTKTQYETRGDGSVKYGMSSDAGNPPAYINEGLDNAYSCTVVTQTPNFDSFTTDGVSVNVFEQADDANGLVGLKTYCNGVATTHISMASPGTPMGADANGNC